MSYATCLKKSSLGSDEQALLKEQVQVFANAGKSRQVSQKLAIETRIEEINQDMKDVQAAIDKAPKDKTYERDTDSLQIKEPTVDKLTQGQLDLFTASTIPAEAKKSQVKDTFYVRYKQVKVAELNSEIGRAHV